MRRSDLAWNRPRLVQRLQQHLERKGWPRVQMALLVALTGGAGLLASFGLLQTGLHTMWLRYPLALGVAYLVFLGLLWLWLRTNASDFVDAAPGDLDFAPGNISTPDLVSGEGGDFAGGGASASFDAPDTTGLGSVGEGLDSVADADEFTIPLIVVQLAAGLALSSLYVVYTAPVLFAELLLDGALAATLFRRLRGLAAQHWIETAVNRTALPFVLTALFLGLCGAAMQAYAPDAHSLGEVLQHAARP
ncbi:MAG: hypothetical protein V4794_19765 [Pseudomonadota bacterium]